MKSIQPGRGCRRLAVVWLAAALGVAPALAHDSEPGLGWRALLNRSQLQLEALPERPTWPRFEPPPPELGLRPDIKLQALNPMALARGTLLPKQLSESSTLRVRGGRIGVTLRSEF